MQVCGVPLLLACTSLLITAAGAQPGHRPGAPGSAPAEPGASVARPAPPQPGKQLANRPAPSAHTPAPSSTQGLATRQPQSTAAARNLGTAARPNITNPQARAITPPVGATAAVAA